MTAPPGYRQLALPFTTHDLWAIVDPAGERRAPWWAKGAAPTRRAVNDAWNRRMKLVETVAANPASLSPPRPPRPPAATWPGACRDRLRQQLTALRTAQVTRQGRHEALRRMAAWR